VLGIIMLITGSRPHFSLSIIPPVITIMLATYGLGFVIGGLTLLFKRIQNVLQLSQFALLFLVMAPVETWQGFLKYAAYLLPLTPSAGMLRELMARNAAFNTGDFAVALVNGIVYFALGLLFFTWADRTAKHRGLLGGY
jgi:ABC-2 type transport system permease protein